MSINPLFLIGIYNYIYIYKMNQEMIMNQNEIMIQKVQSNNPEEEFKELIVDNKQQEPSIKEMEIESRKFESKEEMNRDINQIFDERQLLIINDYANIAKNKEDHKQDLKVELSQKLKNNGKEQIKRQSKKSTMTFERSKNAGSSKESQSCHVPIFKPDSIKRVLWDLFTMLFIFHEIILLPVDLSFQLQSKYLEVMNYITISVFGLDIFINFNTAYQYRGNYIKDRKKIAIQYLKLWFWIDFGSSFPFDLIIDSVQVDEDGESDGNEALKIGVKIFRVLKFFRFIKVMKLLRVLKLKKLFGKLEDYIDLSSAMITLYELLKLVFMMLFVAHWLACIWHLIADYEEQANIDSWLTDMDLVNKPWETKYIASVYWATATMTTVGYGDIVPVTSIEKIFGIIVMLLACCIFAYV